MKYLLSFFFSILSFVFYAQHEILSPLVYRADKSIDLSSQDLIKLRSSDSPTINGRYFYLMDTLQLPFFDEFSKNKFQKYDAQPDDENVETEFYYALLDETDVPFPLGTFFTDFPTYKLEINLETETVDTVWFESVTFKYNPLSEYPVTVYGTYDGFPPYILLDTINISTTPDTVWLVNNLYHQDTAEIYKVTLNDPNSIWQDNQAFHNYTRAVKPWSLGVATLDGLDENGFPYAINTIFSGYADNLTSKPINLNYPASDSVYFSFLFQAGGYSDMPEESDSLIVQFFNVDTQIWEDKWSTKGVPLADFKLVHFPITQPKYLKNGFKFRFRNYGGLSGDLDNWHIDYVNLRRLSGFQDTLVKDFAFVYPVSSLLKTYSAIPWKHFRNNPTGHMTNELTLVVRNGSNLPENNQPGNLKIYYDDLLEHTYTFPGQSLSEGDLNYEPRTVYSSTHDLGQAYAFTTSMPNDTTVTFDYEIAASSPFSQLTNINDTIFGQQHFANYYAYDDWSAELAYGINGAQARLAYQFTSLEDDSLVAIQMHFVPTVNDHSDKIFLLTVWNDNNGKPGQVIYQDDFFTPSMPKYMHTKDLFWNYEFRDGMRIPISGTFYVGWRQIESNALNVGFDANTNVNSKIFYSVDGELNWFNSSYPGALMIRPVVSSKMDYQLSTEEIERLESPLVLYPNPFTETINFSYSDKGTIQIFSLDGKMVHQAEWSETIHVSNLTSGLFIVRVTNEEGVLVNTFKITKQ
jgi:hypothetical protein